MTCAAGGGRLRRTTGKTKRIFCSDLCRKEVKGHFSLDTPRGFSLGFCVIAYLIADGIADRTAGEADRLVVSPLAKWFGRAASLRCRPVFHYPGPPAGSATGRRSGE